MATVSLEHVWKRYRDVVALRDLSLDVEDGELLVLIGPSGCGKTTILRLIAGLEPPDGGTIRIGGRDVHDVPAGERNVSMVFEDYALYPHLVVRENLDFALRIRRTPVDEIRRRVSGVAESMELGHLLERRPPGLAAGEAQHVAIGRAVVREHPTVFLLDDALAHLDARQRLEARAELGRLHRELRTTIVSVTHDQAEALAVGTRVGVMNAGELEQVGSPHDLYERPVSVFVAGFVGSPAMNLVETTVERQDGRPMLRAGPLVVPAPEAVATVAPGAVPARLTVGIRPEHIRVTEPIGEGLAADGEIALRGRCDLVEFLGHQVLVHVRVGDLELRAFDDPARRVRAGDVVDCSVPLERLHLFDTATGRALETDVRVSGAG